MIKFCDRNCKYISCWPLGDVCCNIWGIFQHTPCVVTETVTKQAPRGDLMIRKVTFLCRVRHIFFTPGMLKLVISPNARNSVASFVVVGHLNKQIKNKLCFPGVIYLHATGWVTGKPAPVILPVSLIMEITDQQTKTNSGSALQWCQLSSSTRHGENKCYLPRFSRNLGCKNESPNGIRHLTGDNHKI